MFLEESVWALILLLLGSSTDKRMAKPIDKITTVSIYTFEYPKMSANKPPKIGANMIDGVLRILDNPM